VRMSESPEGKAVVRAVLDGRENFSANFSIVGVGSVCTLESLKASPAGVIGDEIGDSSVSVSAALAARFENGTRSPFRKLPRLYVVRVDLRNEWPGGAAGNIGMSSLAGTSPPDACCSVSKLNLCITFAGSLTKTSSSCRLDTVGSDS